MNTFDYLIVGAGPAGLQLGHEMKKNDRSYLILESSDRPGAFFVRYPRHRTLLSINKVYTGFEDTEINLRWDWNSLLSDNADLLFKNYSKNYLPNADDLVRYLKDFAEHFELNIVYEALIVHITKRDGFFVVTSSDGAVYRGLRLIIATGMSALNVPPVPGIEMAERYSNVSIDPDDFVNQSVLIIGKGNSAFETADSLIETTTYIHVISPDSLALAWESRFVGDLRAVNNNFIDTYQLKCQNAVLDGIVTKIKKQDDGKFAVSVSYSHASGEHEVLTYDRIILAAGFRYDNSLFDDPCRPRLAINDRFPDQTAEWRSTNIPDLYFAGTLMQMRSYKKTTSSFIHGFRYCVRALSRIMEHKYHRKAWRHQILEKDPKTLVEFVLERVNRTSGLWQQFGFLCDLLVIEENHALYFEELPIDLINSPIFPKSESRFVITLEFGKVEGNLFRVERKPNPSYADKSTFLHPIIRHYKGNSSEELHLIEDLHANWRKQEHREPLMAFLEEKLSSENPLCI